MIDTLEITKNLHKAGFPSKQSDALAKEFYKNTESQFERLATKEQIKAIETKMDTKFDSLHRQLSIMMWGIAGMFTILALLIEFGK